MRNRWGKLYGVAVCGVLVATAHADQGSDKQTQEAQSQPTQAQGGQPPEKERVMAGQRVTFEQATTLSRSALTHMDAAVSALEANDDKRAQNAIDAAVASLRTLYDGVPGKELRQALGGDKDIELAPVLATMRARNVYVDPDIVARAQKAEKQSAGGQQEGAKEQLRLARASLSTDVALLPVENAYARAVAAQSELKNGHRERAMELLRGTPLMMQEVVTTAPLVPVRFDLRAAAAAAEQGNWQRAGQLVDQAKQSLQQLAQAPAGSAEVTKQMQSLAKKANDLDQRLDAGKKPKPREFRELAKQTLPAQRGSF